MKTIISFILIGMLTACASAPKPDASGNVSVEAQREYESKQTREMIIGGISGAILGLAIGFGGHK